MLNLRLRTRAHGVIGLGVLWLSSFLVPPSQYMIIGQVAGFVALVGLSARLRCPRCGLPLHTRRVRLFGHAFLFAWPWAPRVCASCRYDFEGRVEGPEGAVVPAPAWWQWSRSKWGVALALCAAGGAIANLVNWLAGARTFALVGWAMSLVFALVAWRLLGRRADGPE